MHVLDRFLQVTRKTGCVILTRFLSTLLSCGLCARYEPCPGIALLARQSAAVVGLSAGEGYAGAAVRDGEAAL